MSDNDRMRWLDLARRQSRSLAESRARHVPPLRLEQGARRPERQRRLSWATLLLPALILGGGTGTWAFVAHLESLRAKPNVERATVHPEGEQARPAARRPAPVVRRPATAPPVVERPVVERPVVERPGPAPAKQTKPAKEQPAAARPGSEEGPQRVTFGSSSEPVIIVSPPAKLGPLWTPEDYKKRHGGRSSW